MRLVSKFPMKTTFNILCHGTLVLVCGPLFVCLFVKVMFFIVYNVRK